MITHGVSRKVQKAFDEGKVELAYSALHGSNYIFKTYKTKTWTIKRIQQLKNEGYKLVRISSFGDKVQIWLYYNWAGNHIQYYQKSINQRVYVFRPLADIEVGHRIPETSSSQTF